jgi:hypothetical protein
MVVKILAIYFLAVILLTGCGESSKSASSDNSGLEAKIGKVCTIQFRRGDGLGAGAQNPVPPNSDTMNGAEVSMVGTLMAVKGDWVVINFKGNEVWIPRSSILLITFEV